MIPLIFFFIGLFIFINFFDYAKTFYDINPGDLVGDVNFESVLSKASMVTPVPGGVGPMTIAMVVSNTLRAAKLNS